MAELNDQFNLSETFSSFTGADINAIITYKENGVGGAVQKLVGTLSSITVSVVREVNPLWSMGSSDFRAVAKGKRSVSGTLVFTVFDRDPLVRDLFDTTAFNQLSLDAKPGETSFSSQTAFVQAPGSSLTSGYNSGADDQSSSIIAAKNVRNLVLKQVRRYADQLPPFDVTISMTNENGASSVAAVRQLYIVSQGGGWSTHDLESDQVYSYIARFYEPLTPIMNK